MRVLALTARDPPSPPPARSLPVPFPVASHAYLSPYPDSSSASTHFSGTTFSPPPGAPGFPRSPKLPDTRRFPPRSPGVIVLAPHVDGLIHVAFGGRLLARALHRGGEGAATYAEPDAARSPRASSLPPSLPGSCKRGSPGGAVSSSRLFPTPQPSLGARTGAGPASRAGGAPWLLRGPARAALQAPPP